MAAMRMLAARLAVAVALAAVALVAVSGSFSGPVRWSPDGLFYQARVHEVRDGLSQSDALQRAFQGPLGADLRAIDPERSGSRQWVAYNARFYERRLAVPYAAAALEPIAGERAILDVSLAGYVAAVLAVFWLLLVLRLPLAVAAGVSLATLLLPALTKHSGFPLTDSWGLALEAAAFATGLLALRRGPKWLIPWAGAIALLSITRDSMWIPILAAGWLAVTQRSRITVALAATGLAAALPAVLAIQVPMRELLGEMLNGGQPAPDASWATILGDYPGAIVDLLQADGGYVRDGAWFSAAYLLAGMALLFVFAARSPRSQAGHLLMAGAVAGAAYVVAVPVFSAFRLELVLVPMAAAGLGFAAQAALARARMSVWGGSNAPEDRPEQAGAWPTGRKAGPGPQAAFSDVLSNRP
jgi:hypothetical protein